MKKILALVIALSAISFSAVAYANDAVKKLPDEINLITSHNQEDATTLNLSWRNPDYAISAITVSEPRLGTISDNAGLSLTSGATNRIALSGLTDGTIYTFTVTITPADTGAATEVFITTGRAASINLERCTEEGYDWTWYFKYENQSDWGGRYIDSSTKASGESSLKIVNNATYIGMKGENDNNFQLQEGYTYEFSFWTKNNLKSGVIKWMDDWTGSFHASVASEWKKNVFTIKDIVSNGNGVSYNVVGIDGVSVPVDSGDQYLTPRLVVDGAGAVWIDDIEFYSIDANGVKSENKFKNGRFESDQGFGGTSGISATGGNETATIAWTNPNGTITESVVLNENLEVVATGNNNTFGANSVTFEGLTNKTLYNYFIRIVTNGVTQYIPVSVVPYDSASSYMTSDGYILDGFKNWEWKSDRVTVSLDGEDKYAGEGALKIDFAYGSWGGLWPNAPWGTTTTGKTYRLSIWAKSSIDSTGTLRIDNTNGEKYIDIPSNSPTWTNYTYDFTEDDNALVHRINEVVPCTGTWWIDEVEIFETDGIGGNIIGENVYANIPEFSFDMAGFGNILVVPNSTSAQISWKNPDNCAITDVYLVDNGDKLVKDDLADTPNATVSVNVDGLIEGTEYTYYAIANTSAGEQIRTPIVFTADNNKPFDSSMWTYGEQDYATEIRQTRDTEVKYSGNSSLKLQNNFIKGWSSIIVPCNNLDKTKKYEISFMYKGENATGVLWSSDDWSEMRTNLNPTSEWQKATVAWGGTDTARIRLGLEGSFDALWIDDMQVREINENGEYISGNLLPDGGFELTTDKVIKKQITDNKAEITLYNAVGADCYFASYDEDGRLVEVEKASYDSDGALVQTFTPEVAEGATYKTYIWNDMTPVK